MADNGRQRQGYGGGLGLVLLLGGLMAVQAAPDPGSPTPAERRQAVLETLREKPAERVLRLSSALNDENAVVRRAAARGLRDSGKPALGVMSMALTNTDAEVRMTAFLALNEQGALGLDHLAVVVHDKAINASLRFQAVQRLARIPLSPVARELLGAATKDESEAVRAMAANVLHPFPFFRKVESIRDHADQVIRIDRIPVPVEGWKLKFDPQHNGHIQAWFAPALNDADWTPVSVGKYWDDYGFKGRLGLGWYRGRFTLPEKPKMNAVEIAFEAVDESAWVWINGVYAGQHDQGPSGYDVPFRLDVTPFLKWGAENQIAVRVLNTQMGGGIWKPIGLEVVNLGN